MTTPLALRRKVSRAISLPRGARVMIGVSGGADSMALLHLLFLLRHDLALDLVVVHFDHALRPGSGRDRLFVKKVAARLGLRCVTAVNRVKLPPRVSVEDFARTRRFDFFIRTARTLKADAVALAHTRDDLAETVLMRIMRGAGLDGIRSILPQRLIHGVLFLRPFLDVTRKEIEGFLRQEKISWREDPTNAGDDFLRNRVRHRLIPFITEEFSPAVKEKLAELALSAGEDYAFMAEQTAKVLPRVLGMQRSKAVIALEPWKRLHPALRRMVLREAARLAGSAVIPLQHILAIALAAEQGSKGVIALPGGFQAIVTENNITLS